MRVLVGMSGGVDSSVAALILKQQGHDVVGCTMILRDSEKGCGAYLDAEDAAAVCSVLGIEHILLGFRDKFSANVMSPFCEEYMKARTPNPCVECNRFIKFGAMLDYALENGFDCIATGHYAKKVFNSKSGLYELHRAKYKDQSYFLCQLNQHQLCHTLFPLADMNKDEIRALAESNALPVHAKRDSQDICFIPDGNVAGFLTERGYSLKKGDIVNENGETVGTHPGAQAYTVGQRKGLGGGFPTPMFVLKVDSDKNRLIIGGAESLFSSRVTVDGVSFISGTAPGMQFTSNVKLRFGSKGDESLITLQPNGGALLEFSSPQRAPTPGQSAVFYDGDTVLGGGYISAGYNL